MKRLPPLASHRRFPFAGPALRCHGSPARRKRRKAVSLNSSAFAVSGAVGRVISSGQFADAATQTAVGWGSGRRFPVRRPSLPRSGATWTDTCPPAAPAWRSRPGRHAGRRQACSCVISRARRSSASDSSSSIASVRSAALARASAGRPARSVAKECLPTIVLFP